MSPFAGLAFHPLDGILQASTTSPAASRLFHCCLPDMACLHLHIGFASNLRLRVKMLSQRMVVI